MNDSGKAIGHVFHSLPASQQAGRVLVIGGESELPFSHFYTPYKGEHDLLCARGKIFADIDSFSPNFFDLVAVVGSKQKTETAFFIAGAFALVKPNGCVMAALANDCGGKSFPKLFSQFISSFEQLSKHKSRIVWSCQPAAADRRALEAAWQAGGMLQRASGFSTRAGTFSWEKTDRGTSVLIDTIRPDRRGAGADFGCGNGDLALFILENCPNVTHLTLLDHDLRSIACARQNLQPYAHKIDAVWSDIPRDSLPHSLDFVVMNPPFHEGKAQSIRLGQDFIRRAAECLKTGGDLTMVANVHLPYEAILDDYFRDVDCLCVRDGFKVISARKK